MLVFTSDMKESNEPRRYRFCSSSGCTGAIAWSMIHSSGSEWTLVDGAHHQLDQLDLQERQVRERLLGQVATDGLIGDERGNDDSLSRLVLRARVPGSERRRRGQPRLFSESVPHLLPPGPPAPAPTSFAIASLLSPAEAAAFG